MYLYRSCFDWFTAVHLQDNQGSTALHRACNGGHDTCVAHLLAKGLFVNKIDFASLYNYYYNVVHMMNKYYIRICFQWCSLLCNSFITIVTLYLPLLNEYLAHVKLVQCKGQGNGQIRFCIAISVQHWHYSWTFISTFTKKSLLIFVQWNC